MYLRKMDLCNFYLKQTNWNYQLMIRLNKIKIMKHFGLILRILQINGNWM